MNQYGIFCSSEMQKVYELSKKFASFPTTVLIEGETGVGKEVIANLIHNSSPRANMPFLKVNCGAIPESLLDSELFGYERGAFTGANSRGSVGLFESADRGSLLLDEIGELSPLLQVKLLRVLQEREVRKIGSSWSKPIDVRIITCTNKNLWDAVKCDTFRMDLFYRLSIATVSIPPLRQRKDDILPLLEHFLQEFNELYGMEKSFDESSLNVILNHKFPGNVRELRNIVEVSYITAEKDIITVDDLPKYLVEALNSSLKFIDCDVSENMPSLPKLVESFEKEIISNALQSASSIRRAASMLGISNATLLRRIKLYNLEELAYSNS
ncbi:sigma 54-interacting transcriptional regulator [Proteiniborus sp.]|uniref:sigma-54 interaction domain-containing protein n=1 Tax=Proteiniborus sp. TaxID=2079015 RepID=UPI0033252B88